MKFQNILQPIYLSLPLIFPYSSTYGLKQFEKTESFLRKGENGRKDIARVRSLNHELYNYNSSYLEQYVEKVEALVEEVDAYSTAANFDIMAALRKAEVIILSNDGTYINAAVRGVYLINEIYKKLDISGSFDLSDPCDGEYGAQMCASRNEAIRVCQLDPTCDAVALASVPFTALEGSVLLNTELAAMLICISNIGDVPYYNYNSTLTEWQGGIELCNFIIEEGNQGHVDYMNITQNVIDLQLLVQNTIGFDHPILNLGSVHGVADNKFYFTGYSPPELSIAEEITSQNGYFDLYVTEQNINSFLTIWPAMVDENLHDLGGPYQFKRDSAAAYIFAKYSKYINDDITGYYDFRGDIGNVDILFGITASKAIKPKTFEELFAVQHGILEVASNYEELKYEIGKCIFNFFL